MSKRASLLIKIGLLLTAAALCLAAYNLYEGVKAGNAAADAAAKIDAFIEESGEACVFDPDMEMPTVQLDGYEYIGVLRIQALSLELPVMSEWSYSALKIAPCRYAGSAYSGDLVIAAHNYSGHFGQIKGLSLGDELSFTDADGNVFYYTVAEIETLSPFATEEMTSSGWDLTLFTCTVGGASRVTVRCEKVE